MELFNVLKREPHDAHKIPFKLVCVLSGGPQVVQKTRRLTAANGVQV
ncbi:MAG: hypothetical protein V2A34_11095 [Lentisphaerota bacterium]